MIMKLELITTLNNMESFMNNLDCWFVISMFFFCMWGITLFLLVRKKHPIKSGKTREVKDWKQLLRGYSSLLVVWLFYLVSRNH